MLAVALTECPSAASLCRTLAGDEHAIGAFVLDSDAEHHEGRFTFASDGPVEIRAVRHGDAEPFALFDSLSLPADPLEAPIEGLDEADIPHWVGYVSYDAAWADAPRLGLRRRPRHARADEPIAWFARYDRMVAIDHRTGRAYALANDLDGARALEARLRRASSPRRSVVGEPTVRPAASHAAAIARALEAIGDGDIYQINLARRWQAAFHGSAVELFLAMREASPVPFGMFLAHDDGAIASRSMERFLRWERRSGALHTSPIKGTIARRSEDRREASVLRRDEKERAEHAMIVDLMRNDLSRVARAGSVRVDAPFRVEPYRGLSHLVSTVRCETRSAVTPREILEATFPPESITGTPKVRAMEWIEALEPCARGVYTGALGHVDRTGGVSLSVGIRTATITKNVASYFAGGGIVEASVIEREVAETELKARVFLDALEALRKKHD